MSNAKAKTKQTVITASITVSHPVDVNLNSDFLENALSVKGKPNTGIKIKGVEITLLEI